MSIVPISIRNASVSHYSIPPVAGVWHTLAVLALLAVMIALSRNHATTAPPSHGRIAGYALVMLLEWTITAFIWFGCRLRVSTYFQSTGHKVLGWRSLLADTGLAIGFLLASNIVLSCMARLLHVTPNSAVRDLLPRGGAETLVFLLLALTAAICEEIIYRGYLQSQFAACTKSLLTGIMLQSAIFGISHAYQGWGMVLSISVYGCLFGLLAQWRLSLRPGMIAHFLQNGVGGVLLARIMFK